MKLTFTHVVGISLGTLLITIFNDNIQIAVAFNSISTIMLALLTDPKKRDKEE